MIYVDLFGKRSCLSFLCRIRSFSHIIFIVTYRLPFNLINVVSFPIDAILNFSKFTPMNFGWIKGSMLHFQNKVWRGSGEIRNYYIIGYSQQIRRLTIPSLELARSGRRFVWSIWNLIHHCSNKILERYYFNPLECHLVVTIVHYWPPGGIHLAGVMAMIALHIK